MDLGEILGNISFSAILILGMMYILPKIKSEFKEYIIEVMNDKK